MNTACATSRLVRPSATSRQTRHSPAVSAPGPVSYARRAPWPDWSSVRARSASAVAPHSRAKLHRPPRDIVALAQATGPCELRAEVGERVRQLEAPGARLEHRDRLLEPVQAPLAVGRERPGAEREAERHGRGDTPGQVQLLFGEPLGRVGVAERGERGRGDGPPMALPLEADRLEPLAAPQQVGDAPLGVALRDPQAPARDQVLVEEDPVLGDATGIASPRERVGHVELTPLDVDGDQDGEELAHAEVRLLHELQSRLRVHLRVAEGALLERDPARRE